MQINDISKIRNFSIIAHIDHGKSTLADRILELTGTIPKREMKDRILDTLELEQERGITIKLQTVRMLYNYEKATEAKFVYDKNHSQHPVAQYILNLIDTPGHVDFSYEVSRSLAASEGAILLVDATQGVQAQTISNVYKALENDLTIIPIVNKIDLPNARIDETIDEIVSNFGFSKEEILKTSGKTGEGVTELLHRIIEIIPAPKQKSNELKALVFDSFFDEHKGVVALVKIESGTLDKNNEINFFQSHTTLEPIEIGYLTPNFVKQDRIFAGEVGYVATGLKDIRSVHVGDTLTKNTVKENFQPLPGYKQPKPMVFASLFPVDADEFTEFKDSLEKLALNDAALVYQKESSSALGAGYLCGFLGLLHLEITLERLLREFDINLISTTPSVEYRITLTTKDTAKLSDVNTANLEGNILKVKTAAEFPDLSLVEKVAEPWVRLEIITPDNYIGPIMELAKRHRALYKTMEYVSESHQIKTKKHVILKYEIPTAEIITNFFDSLKSISQGYASLDYEFLEYRSSDIVKVGILVNYEIVEPLSFLSHRQYAESRGRQLVAKLKDIIPKQQFKIPIQAAIGGKVIARETISAYRKDVTAKLYGGDVTRKKKLLEKQKKGKKRLKMFGKVEIPQEAFLLALKITN